MNNLKKNIKDIFGRFYRSFEMNHKYNYKYDWWMSNRRPIYIYNHGHRRGGSTLLRLFIGALIGVYVAQNYEIPKLSGPIETYRNVKDYLNKNRKTPVEKSDKAEVKENDK